MYDYKETGGANDCSACLFDRFCKESWIPEFVDHVIGGVKGINSDKIINESELLLMDKWIYDYILNK